MKTVLDKETRDELIKRIGTLNENNRAAWGKMDIYQMLKHCSSAEEMFLGRVKFKRSFIGKIFGKMALKGFMKDDTPMKPNMPTLPQVKVKAHEKGDVLTEKAKWIAQVEAYAHFSNPDFSHPFFGPMTEEQTGYLVYKHIDHHLRQFNS